MTEGAFFFVQKKSFTKKNRKFLLSLQPQNSKFKI